jgi:hypothetical protein
VEFVAATEPEVQSCNNLARFNCYIAWSTSMQQACISVILSLFPDAGNSISHDTLGHEGLLKKARLLFILTEQIQLQL